MLTLPTAKDVHTPYISDSYRKYIDIVDKEDRRAKEVVEVGEILPFVVVGISFAKRIPLP